MEYEEDISDIDIKPNIDDIDIKPDIDVAPGCTINFGPDLDENQASDIMDADTTSQENHLHFETEVEIKPIDIKTDLDNESYLLHNYDTNMAFSGIESVSSSDTNVSMRCVNCGVDVFNLKSHYLHLVEQQSVLKQWIAPQVVTDQTIVCNLCVIHATNNSSFQENAPNNGPHRQPCVNCGRSLLRRQSKLLHINSEKDTHFYNKISEFIAPKQLTTGARVCRACWERARRAVLHDQAAAARAAEALTAAESTTAAAEPTVVAEPPTVAAELSTVTAETSEPQEPKPQTIKLPNIKRASNSQSSCFFPNCKSNKRMKVPMWLRVKLFADFKYYVPKRCRICSLHLLRNDWGKVIANIERPIHTFTAEHIEDFASFVKETNQSFNFENIEVMSDQMIQYWLGITRDEYVEMKTEFFKICGDSEHSSLALTAYLIKLRTGDSDKRISTLLRMSQSTVAKLLHKARDIMQ